MDVTLKSSDGDTRSGISEPQPTEPMQTSPGVASFVLGKREDPGESEGDRESVDDVKDDDEEEDSDSHWDKDSFDGKEYNSSDEVKDEDEDEDEDEEEEDEVEEDSDSHWDKDSVDALAYVSSDEVKEEEEEDPNWDKDSFDGKEYNSSDYDGDYSDKELDKMSRCYYRTVLRSKGFFDSSKGFPPCIWGGFGRVQNLDSEILALDGITVRQFLINLATECVEKYNKKKKKNVRFHHLLRSNVQGAGMVKYYITFVARESDSLDDPLIEYQAKVGRRGGKSYPILCRPSPQ